MYMKRLLALIVVLCSVAACAWAEPIDESTLLSFYDDGVLFGDSLTQGLRRYRSAVQQTDKEFLSETEIVYSVSISLYEASRRNLLNNVPFRYRGKVQSMYQIAQQIDPQKVFILLGLNDRVGEKVDKAISWVEYTIKGMQEYVPDAQLYFFSLTPVTASYARSVKDKDYQQKLDKYNLLLKETCEQNGAFYIEIAEPLKDETGHLSADYTSDKKCHLNDEGNALWIKAMCDYAQEQYDLGLWTPETEQ